MNLKLETNFTVYPHHANCMYPMIFGGAFFSELDMAAATAVRRLLYDSEFCKTSVTHKADVTYHKPCYVGDLVFIEAEIVSLGKKSVVVETKAYREKAGLRELVASAKFVFVTVTHDEDVGDKPDLLPYHVHGLKMPSDS